MSGWTCITVEPEKSSEQQEIPDEYAAKICRIASELDNTSTSIEQQQELLRELESQASAALTEVGAVDTNKIVKDWLKDWTEGFFDRKEHAVLSPETPTVQYPSRGKALPDTAEEILTRCPYANRVLVVHANDTSDSGKGYLYEMQDGEFVKVDEWAGYEGAVGSDVVGYFREEHNISGLSRPY